MTTLISPIPKLQFFDNNGAELTGGKLFTYIAGTTTKQATYTDSTGGTPNTNPVILNSRGEASVWLTQGQAYKFVLSPSTDTDPPTNSIWTVDQISGGISTIANNTILGNSSGGVALPTGQTLGFGLVLSGGVLSSVLQNFIGGLNFANDIGTPNTVIDIALGAATDSSNTVVISLGNFTKSISGSWTAGSGNNGMGVGLTATASTWYHVFVIINQGTPDVYFDTSVTASNSPVGTSAYRRIGSILLDGSANILPFAQIGNRFFWRTGRTDVSNATTTIQTTTAVVTLTSVPPGINFYTHLRVSFQNTASPQNLLVYSVAAETSPTGKTLQSSTVTTIPSWTEMDVLTTTTQAIGINSTLNTSNTVNVVTVSYLDQRGT